MGAKVYTAVLAIVFAVAILAGTYHALPPWLVWLVGIGLAILVGMAALTILGARILRGDFDPQARDAKDE